MHDVVARDVKLMDLRQLRNGLSGVVAIRLPRAWLAIGGAVFVVLLLVALD